MCVVDYEFMLYPASMVAAGCISTATAGLRGTGWCHEVALLQTLQTITGIDAVSTTMCVPTGTLVPNHVHLYLYLYVSLLYYVNCGHVSKRR